MSKTPGPRDEIFHCTRVHVIHRTPEERAERWEIVAKWMKNGTIPVDLPEWVEVLANHGGGGGP